MKAFGTRPFSPSIGSQPQTHQQAFQMGQQPYLFDGGNSMFGRMHTPSETSSYSNFGTTDMPPSFMAGKYPNDFEKELPDSSLPGFSIEMEKQKLRDIEMYREKVVSQRETPTQPQQFMKTPRDYSNILGDRFKNADLEKTSAFNSQRMIPDLTSQFKLFEQDEHQYTEGEHYGRERTSTKENSVEFLSMRIAALEEIIEIQNNEINEFHNGNNDSTDLLKKGKHNLQVTLVNKWRSKVFSLLLQLKLRGISEDALKKDFQKKETEHQKEVKQLKYEIALSKHKEKDLKASINFLEEQLKKHDISKYSKEIEKLNREKEFISRKFEQELKSLKEDRALIEDQNKAKWDDVSRKFDTLNKELEITRNEYSMKCAEVEKLNNSLGRAEQTIANELNVVKSLKSKLTEYQHQAERDKKDFAFNAVRIKDEEMTRLEIELNESRSEVSKLTFKIKHLERLLIAEQQGKQKDDKEKYDYYEMKLSAKEEEIKALKKERNSLLSSIRHQEVMIDNQKKREKPKPLPKEIDVKSSSIIPSDFLNISNNPSPKPPTQRDNMSFSSPQSLSEKLRDLSSLTKKFLQKNQQEDDEYL